MRWLGFLAIVLATALPVRAEDWTTADGKTYRNVVVIAQEDDGVRITYTGGVGKIPYYELSPDLLKRFGQDYDSLEAKRQAAAQALEEATRNEAAAAAAAAELKKQQEATNPGQANAAPVPAPPSSSTASQSPSSSVTSPAPHTAVPQPAPAVTPVEPALNSSSLPPPSLIAEVNLYPGSKFSYNQSLDLCFLDSPGVQVWPVFAEAAPAASLPAPGTLTLRIMTEGHTPQTPDRIQATFTPGNSARKSSDVPQTVKFLVDGNFIPVDQVASNSDDTASLVTPAPGSISFYLTPQQAQSIFQGKNVNFSVGSDNYRMDQNGIAVFQKYFDDVRKLPPASPNLVRIYHKFIARLPSIITVISTVCMYIILGAFAIVVAGSVAAFVMGMTRFIKM